MRSGSAPTANSTPPGVDTLTNRLAEAFTRHRSERVLLDLTDVAFVDAAGVRALLLGRRRACAGRIVLRLVATRGLVQRVLQLTGGLDVLTTEPSGEPTRPHR